MERANDDFLDWCRYIWKNHISVKKEQNGVVVYVSVPIWHPGVFSKFLYTRRFTRYCIAGDTLEDTFKTFTDLKYAISNPANIDASVMLMTNTEKFYLINRRLRDAASAECAICLEDNNQEYFYCYNGHVFHEACILKLQDKICPTCRKRL